MRTMLAMCGVAAALAAGSGCRGVTAGRCDCTNHPEAGFVPPAAHTYPVVGGPAVAPSSVMGGSAPTAMPAPEKMPVVPGK